MTDPVVLTDDRRWLALVKVKGGTESVRAFPTPVPGLIINEGLPDDPHPEWLHVTHARSGLALFAHESAEVLAGAVLDLATSERLLRLLL